MSRRASKKPQPAKRKGVAPLAAQSTVSPKDRAEARNGRENGASAISPSAEPHWHEALLDGTRVLIRPIGKGDTELERAFMKHLSPGSSHMRFLGEMSEPSDDLLHCLTDLDYGQDMAFVALLHRDGETQEIGVSRYGSSIDGKSCECAVTVSDGWRQRGLATVLMRHLIDYARARGIRKMVSFDSRQNIAMRELAEFLGFERKPDPRDATMVVHSLDL